MKSQELENELPESIRINAPLVNGDAFLRNLPFRAEGPYSSSYGGCLYAIAKKDDVLNAHRRARGINRAEIEWLVGQMTDDEYMQAVGY